MTISGQEQVSALAEPILRCARVFVTGVVAFLALSLASGIAAGASTAGPGMTTADVAQEAKQIVFARHLGTHMERDRGGVWTVYDFEVLDIVKGRLPGRTFTMRLLGGEFEGFAVVVVDDLPNPEFDKDEEVVLFLGRDNGLGNPSLYVANIFRVQADSKSRNIVTPRPTGMTVYRSSDGQPHERMPSALWLDDFLFSLRQMVGK